MTGPVVSSPTTFSGAKSDRRTRDGVPRDPASGPVRPRDFTALSSSRVEPPDPQEIATEGRTKRRPVGNPPDNVPSGDQAQFPLTACINREIIGGVSSLIEEAVAGSIGRDALEDCPTASSGRPLGAERSATGRKILHNKRTREDGDRRVTEIGTCARPPWVSTTGRSQPSPTARCLCRRPRSRRSVGSRARGEQRSPLSFVAHRTGSANPLPLRDG